MYRTFINPLIVFAVVVLTTVGCSPRLTPLTANLKASNQWTDAELSSIQFYLSEDITLSRERKDGSTEIERGRVRVENGRTIEEVVIQRGTPGVVLFTTKKGNLAIGFDAKNDDNYLIFGPNPKMNDRYSLLAKSWSRGYGTVRYGNQEWRVRANNADVALLFRLDKKGETEYKVSTPSGRRID